MADVILYLDQKEFKSLDIYNYLSRKDLSDLAGMSTESAVRVLSEFDRSGIIALSGKTIEILDYRRLENISRSG